MTAAIAQQSIRDQLDRGRPASDAHERVVREHTDRAWDEGYRAGWSDRNEDEHAPLPAGEQHDTANPYAARQEQSR